MLTKYINKAMSKAVYDKLEDGSFLGKIPQLHCLTLGKKIAGIADRKKNVLLFRFHHIEEDLQLF